jgi:hypothetical protein
VTGLARHVSVRTRCFSAAVAIAFLSACGGVQRNDNRDGTGGAGASDVGGAAGSGGQFQGNGADAGNLFGFPGGTSGVGTGGVTGIRSLVCGLPLPDTSGLAPCGAGVLHRFAQVDCAPAVPVPACENISYDSDAGLRAGECLGDEDCRAAPNGYCNVDLRPTSDVGCACAYGCIRDADCGKGQICLCGTPAGQCVTGSCTTDSDCGAGLLCLSYNVLCGNETGFACQTPLDQCATDADCASCCGGGTCQLSFDGHRTCGYADCGFL